MQRIGKYGLVSDFSTAGGGQSRWAFARRGGSEYFIKEFLSPTYPLPDGPGSAATKAHKLKRCQAFERHHQEVQAALAPLSREGGNLIVTRDFFRHGAKYYKVTDKVDVSSLSIDQISVLAPVQRLVLAGTVTHSLQILHRQKLVHGDIKPPNVLIKETVPGSRPDRSHYAAKLIDFDSAYYEKRPPPPDELVGDPSYYAPETLLYIQEEISGERLTSAVDIFALGLLLSEYLVGHRPEFSGSEITHCAVGILRRTPFCTGLEDSWPQADSLIRDMLALDFARRPSVGQVFERLKGLRREERTAGKGDISSASRGRLRGTLAKTRPAIPDDSPDTSSAGLRGTLGGPPSPTDGSSEVRLKGSLSKKSPRRR